MDPTVLASWLRIVTVFKEQRTNLCVTIQPGHVLARFANVIQLLLLRMLPPPMSTTHSIAISIADFPIKKFVVCIWPNLVINAVYWETTCVRLSVIKMFWAFFVIFFENYWKIYLYVGHENSIHSIVVESIPINRYTINLYENEDFPKMMIFQKNHL